MQNYSLRRAIQSRSLAPLPDESWPTPLFDAKSVGNFDNLDAAAQALRQAETVIRSQAERIRQLESLAMTDELTGLSNRRGFTLGLRRELALARRDGAAKGVVIMLDLDGFKSINDQWGHGVGDGYLQAVGQTLLGAVRSSDIVARLGGDEFAILFPRMSENAGLKRLGMLEKSFNSRMVQVEGNLLPLRASFGLSPYDGNAAPDDILANADLKLYAHKASRRDTNR